MQKIKLLDKELINKIAAGEVVERPASVVKELIENSLDAGATSISVEIESGGLDVIRITDNGSGMSPEDAKLSIRRHATSKIATVNDLHNISTLGFRGEALAAISSVSVFRILTRQKGAVGATEVKVNDGEVVLNQAAGSEGTVIEIKGLFHTVPARKKFMKTGSTEFRFIHQAVVQQVLLTPHVSWKLLHNKKMILDLPAVSDWKDRVISILGTDLGKNLIEINHQRGSLILSGFLVHPALAREKSKDQYLFVNKRPVSDYVLSKAIKEGYGNHIAYGMKPAFVLQISIAPDLVDVNVHPRKSEVKFADPSSIYRELLRSVRDSLSSIATDPVQIASFESRPGSRSKTYSLNISPKPSEKSIHQSFEFQKQLSPHRSSLQRKTFFTEGSELNEIEEGWRLLGQAHDSYLIAETPNGIMMIDQHAVAEKILFEELMLHIDEPKTQSLLVPTLIELSANQKALIDSFGGELASMGIEGEMFGGNSYRLSGMPQNVKAKEIKKFFLDILDDMNEEIFSKAPSLKKRQEELAKMASCRGAIKFGDPLSLEEQIQLLKDVKRLNIVACCHGRPAIIKMTKEQLNKQFHRP